MKKPKIGIVITPSGVESITLLGGGSEEQSAANDFCSSLKQELSDFELIIQQKFGDALDRERNRVN